MPEAATPSLSPGVSAVSLTSASASEETAAVNVAKMRQAADTASSMLRLLANPDRLLLLCQLAEHEACVTDLELLVDIRQPTLSQQLAVLRREKLVTTRRSGKHIYYRISDGPAMAILKLLYQLYCADSCQRPADELA